MNGLAVAHSDIPPASKDCGRCNYLKKASNSLTAQQTALVKHLASGKHDSVQDALKAAGYAETTARTSGYMVASDPKIQIAVAERRQRRTDKARSLSKLARSLLESGGDQLASTPDALAKIQGGAVIAKSAVELGDTTDDTALDGDALAVAARRQLRKLIRRTAAPPQHLLDLQQRVHRRFGYAV